MVNNTRVIQIIERISEKIEAEKDYLTKLDQPIGDSDHGINMARGFKAVEKKLPDLLDKDIGTILKTVGMTLVSTVGGASGPLYGSAFLKAGIKEAGKTELSIDDFMDIIDVSVDAVKYRGKSTTEEKTMLDAMVPSQQAMHAAEDAGSDLLTILNDGVSAAWKGVEHTKDLIATKGRASYLGERSIGHQDPGATSYSFILEVIRDQIQKES